MFNQTANNAFTTFLGGIGASATSLIVKTGDGQIFPSTFPYQLTLEKFDTSGQVIKREIANVTARSGDTFTIERAFEKCVQNDTAEPKEQTQNPLSFDSGDKVSLYVTAGNDKQIKEELTRLETAKLDIDGGIRTGLTPNSITYVDENGDESFLEYDPEEDAGKALLIDPTTGLRLESPAVNVEELNETSTPKGNFIISTETGNEKISEVNLLRANKEVFVAGENITAGDALYIDNTDGKTYKTQANNTAKLNFIGFATNTATTGNNVIVDTSGVSATQSGLTVGSDFYLGNRILGVVSNSTNVTYVGNSTGTTLGRTGERKNGQYFIMNSNSIIRNIKVRLARFSTPTDDLSCYIYGEDKETIIATALNTINGTSLTTSLTQQTFDFGDILLKANTRYFLVISRNPINSSNTNYYLWGQGTTANPAGNTWTYNGTTWTEVTTSRRDYEILTGTATLSQITDNPLLTTDLVKSVGKSTSNNGILMSDDSLYYKSSNNIIHSDTPISSTNSLTYVLLKEHTINRLGEYLLEFELRSNNASGWAVIEIRINNEVITSEESVFGNTYLIFTKKALLKKGDKIEIYGKINNASYNVNLRNFYIKADLSINN